MFTRKSILSMFCVLILLVSVLPVQNAAASGLSADDWSQLRALSPALAALAPDTLQAYLKSSNSEATDNFGGSMSLSGDTLVVGANGEDSNATGVNGNGADNTLSGSGAAYVFVRNAGVWSQQAYLKASNTGASDGFGVTVGISGDTIVVGALSEGSSATGVNGSQADNSASGAGAAYVFTRSAGVWTQQAYLKASNTASNDQFGYSVAISGDTIAVGARLEDSNATGINGNGSDNSASGAGAVYVFTRSAGLWTQQAYVKASNSGANDQFGYSLALTGDTLAVGAMTEASSATGVNGNQADDSAFGAGAVYVFTRSAAVWSQQAYLKASNAESNDQFGIALAISGNTLVVGANFEDSGATGVNGNQADNTTSAAGAVYVFTSSAGVWSQQAYVKASNPNNVDVFGASLAISGDTLVVGANLEDSNATGPNGNETDNSASASGAAYLFTRSGTSWSQKTYLKSSNSEAGDDFGISMALSSDTLAVGAYFEDSDATGVNGSGANNLALSSGAAYVYSVTPPSVVSSIRVNPTPTNLTSISYTVTFSEPVTGVDLTDFSLAVTSVSGASITGVTGSGATRTVTINTGTGNGTIRLNVLDNDTIVDLSSNPLGGTGGGNGAFTTGQIYTIDKTITLPINSIGAHDGWILESTETSGLGGTMDSAATTLRLGDETTRKQYRSILSFNTSTLPDNAVITVITLKFKQQGIIGGGDPVAAFQGFMVDMKSGFFNTFPALQLVDFSEAASATYGPFSPVPVSGVYYINLIAGKTNINRFATNSGVTQIRLRFNLDDDNNATANYLSLHSGDAAVVADRPQLVIKYFLP